MSMRGYARHRGVSVEAVSQAVRDGRIPTTNGKLDPDAADAAWDANTDATKPRAVVGDKARATGPAPGVTALAISRARREEINVELARLELAARAGALVSVEDVARETADRIVRAKAKAMAAVDAYTSAIVQATTPEKARAAGLALLNEFLEAVSKAEDDDDKPRKKRRR